MTEPVLNIQTSDAGAHVDNMQLRFLIRDAAEREVKIALAPYLNDVAGARQEAQVARGMAQQLNRDYTALGLRIEDCEEVLQGNSSKGLKGLVATVGDIKKTLDEFTHNARVLKYLLGALIALGVFDAIGVTGWLRQVIGVLPQ